jgi:hypothetical protein
MSRQSSLLASASTLALVLMGPAAPARAQAPPPPDKPPVAADVVATALWDGRKIAPFRALDDPPMVKSAAANFLDDGDYVLGITVNGDSRAYPARFASWHHVVNDRLGREDAGGEVPVAVTYCSVCNTGIAYDRRLEGTARLLDFFGLYNGVVALCDRETESAFLQVDGRFVTGTLLGKKLKPLPLLDTTWGEWKRLHPDTRVMSPETPYRARYRPRGQAEARGYDRFPAPFFAPSVTRGDRRLPPFEKVLGVTLPAAEADSLYRAYPVRALEAAGGAVNDTLGEVPVAVLFDPASATAVACSRRVDERVLTLEARKGADGRLAFFDRETGTRWSLEGRGEEGPLAGKALPRLENHLSQWYGWVAFFPSTTIYGRNDPPQPGNPFEPPPSP